jgi:hypothetical protein
MDKEASTNSQEQIEQFRQALEEARQLQTDWITHGLDFVELYIDDWDGEWLSKWVEDEKEVVLASIIRFLESDDRVAIMVRNLLIGKSLPEIAIELERCFHLGKEKNLVFAIKDVLIDNLPHTESNPDSHNVDNNINLLQLAEDLIERLRLQ